MILFFSSGAIMGTLESENRRRNKFSFAIMNIYCILLKDIIMKNKLIFLIWKTEEKKKNKKEGW